MEKVGVVARKDGRVGLIEYTELDPELRDERDAGGDLVYGAGNIAIHVLATSFVRRVAADADDLLPFHASTKKIPTVDADGRPVAPSKPNGRKLERFVFDALPAAERVCVVEARRAEEFSPVKNAENMDSPATARRDLVARYRSWLQAGGIEGAPAGTAIEIDHSRIDGPEDARALGIRSIAEGGDVILTEPGANP
jgi:UDP-N-acetylglucosamine/UDP-N-acetylgalactosamine diphosphorylase